MVSSALMNALATTCVTLALLAGLIVVSASQGGPAAPAISTAHAEIVSTARPESAAPGTTFTLSLDVAPHDGIRIYASGTVGYKPVTLTLKPQPFLGALPVRVRAGRAPLLPGAERAPAGLSETLLGP